VGPNSPDNAQTRTLQRALSIAGSAERLAAALATDVDTLRSWLAGEARASTDAYLKALDIVARGERNPRLR
jgi:DNA-binding transcriptional regulator YiaG